MQRGRLPLTSLRMFEAAGRLLSFTAAADELCVSQAAVSRQVRELETGLGRRLFERRHRRVELTEGGIRLLAQLTTSFDDIDRELGHLRSEPASRVLVVSVEPGFAAGWLVPRLARFQALRPDIDVAVESDARLVEFRADGAEIAIRYSAKDMSWPRTRAERLTEVVMTPVLTPGLLASGPALSGPADLARHTLLHEENRAAWTGWFEMAGVPEIVPRRGPLLADGALAVQAALLGHGVALGDLALVAEDIAVGRLVAPFATRITLGAYWLVMPDRQPPGEHALAFADWLTSCFGGEAGDFPRIAPV